MSDEEDRFLRLALLAGFSGAILSVVGRIVNIALYEQYFTALPENRQFWMLLTSYTSIFIALASFMVAAGGYAFLRRNGSRYGLVYTFVYLIGYAVPLTSWYSILPSYIAYPVAVGASFLYDFVAAFLLWQVRDAFSNRQLLLSVVAVQVLDLPLIYALNFFFPNILDALSIPLSYITFNIPGIAVTFFSMLLLGYLFLVERRRVQFQEEVLL
jgi:hypothetical protein